MGNFTLHRLLGLTLLTLASATAAHAQQAAPLRGDVNGDGRVTAVDAQAVRDHVAGRPVQPGMLLLPNGDANDDGRITGVDAAMIQAFAAGRDVSRFGVGQPIRGGGAGGGGETRGGYITTVHECTVDVEAGTESCRTPRPAMAASADIIMGKPDVSFVNSNASASRGNPADEDTTQANMAVTNNIGQPLGTLDGTSPAPTGVRVFFSDGPRVTAVKSGTLASAGVRIEDTDGTADFAGPDGEFPQNNRAYFQYDGVLATGGTSVAKLWRFVYTANTKSFYYAVAVSAPVQFEHGWITISPASLVLAPGQAAAALTATVRGATGATLGDAVTWSSSDPAVATVDASGVVTAVAEGTATITATSTVKAQRTGSVPVRVDAAPTVTSTTPANGATQVAANGDIAITFSEAVDATTSSFTLECPAATAKTFAVSGSGTATITLNPDADLPAGTTCTVNVVGNQVSDSDTYDDPNMMAGNYSFSFEVNIQAVADVFGTTTTGNVRINSASTSPMFSVTANDHFDPASTTISFAGWNGVAGKTQQGGGVTMTTSGAGMGQFVYNPPAGFEGTDSLEYTITSGAASASAKVALPVSGMIWFVDSGATGCTTRADGCGRLTNPYSTLAAFNAENNGTGNNPAANQAVFLYQSTTDYAGPVTLLNGQKLIGQDASATLQAISGITPAAGSDALPAMDAAGDAVTISGNDGVNLGTGNTLRGLTLAPTAGEAIGGTGFGTLTLATSSPDVTINAGGQALSLTTGTITGTFASVASAGGTNNVLLSGVTGDIDFGTGALSGSTGGAVKIVGGALTLDAGGNITQAAAAPLLDVSGTHTGALTFTGTLNATAGTGLQFSDADGTYSFAGTTTLAGGDAGIDITAGSGGTFTFASGTGVTNPSGTAFRVAASTPGVTFNGNLTKNAASLGLLVDISGQASGTITFANGTLTGTSSAGTGIQLSDVDGTVSFNGTTTLSGGDNGVDVIGGSTGAITFAAGSTITNPSGIALRVFNGAASANVAFAGNISTNAGRPVHVEGVSGGTVNVTGTIAATGQGLLAQNNTGGTFSFTSATKTLNTGANAAVTLSNNGSATVSFTNGLAITTTSGNGFAATGGGNVTVQNGINTIAAGTGTALNVTNTTIAAGGLNFRSISANGAPNGIVLNNTGSTASLTVAGNGSADTGGTIQNTTGGDGTTSGIGIYLNNTVNPSFSWMQLNNHAGWAVKGVSVSGFTMNKTRITGVNGTDAGTDEGSIHFTGLSGSASITNSRIEGGLENNLTVVQSSGVLDRLTLTGDTIGANGTSLGENGISLEATGGAMNVTVQNSVFTSARARNFRMLVQASGVADLVFSGNVLSNNHPNMVTAASNMDVAVGGSGSLTYLISGNAMRDSRGTALYLGKVFAGSFGNGSLSGTVSGNQIGVAGVANSGSTIGSAIELMVLGRGFHRSMVQNNQLRGYNGQGLLLTAGGASEATTGLVHDAALDVTVQDNVMAEPGSNVAISTPRNGISLNAGTNSGDDYPVCLNLSGNTVTGSGADPAGFGTGQDYRLRQRQSTSVRLPGYAGAATNASGTLAANVSSYLTPRTSGAFTLNVTAQSTGFTGGAACATP